MNKKPNVKERLIISDFFESETYQVIRKYYIEGERLEIAIRALQAPSWEQSKFLQGQADALKQLHLQIREINKQEKKKNG